MNKSNFECCFQRITERRRKSRLEGILPFFLLLFTCICAMNRVIHRVFRGMWMLRDAWGHESTRGNCPHSFSLEEQLIKTVWWDRSLAGNSNWPRTRHNVSTVSPAKEQMMIKLLTGCSRFGTVCLTSRFGFIFGWWPVCWSGLVFIFFLSGLFSQLSRREQWSWRVSLAVEENQIHPLSSALCCCAHPTSRPRRILAHIWNYALPFEYVD